MKRTGFTLVEMLVVIAVAGLLIALLLPAVQRSRETARRAQCMNHLRQIGVAVHGFEAANKQLPSGIFSERQEKYRKSTWLFRLLPYIEQTALWNQAVNDFAVDPIPYRSHVAMRTPVKVYGCPSEPGVGEVHYTYGFIAVATTSYLAVNGLDYRQRDGAFYLDSKVRFGDITDGLSNTILVGERPPSPDYWYGWWYAGNGQGRTGSLDMLLGTSEIQDGSSPLLQGCSRGPVGFQQGKFEDICSVMHFWSLHVGGANFLQADGSVRPVGYSAGEMLNWMATISGGEQTAD